MNISLTKNLLLILVFACIFINTSNTKSFADTNNTGLSEDMKAKIRQEVSEAVDNSIKAELDNIKNKKNINTSTNNKNYISEENSGESLRENLYEKASFWDQVSEIPPRKTEIQREEKSEIKTKKVYIPIQKQETGQEEKQEYINNNIITNITDSDSNSNNIVAKKEILQISRDEESLLDNNLLNLDQLIESKRAKNQAFEINSQNNNFSPKVFAITESEYRAFQANKLSLEDLMNSRANISLSTLEKLDPKTANIINNNINNKINNNINFVPLATESQQRVANYSANYMQGVNTNGFGVPTYVIYGTHSNTLYPPVGLSRNYY